MDRNLNQDDEEPAREDDCSENKQGGDCPKAPQRDLIIRAALATSCQFMPSRAKSWVHIWCLGNCRKLKFLESRGVAVNIFHVANVNVVSSNLIGMIFEKTRLVGTSRAILRLTVVRGITALVRRIIETHFAN